MIDSSTTTFDSRDLMAIVKSNFRMLEDLRDIFEEDSPQVLLDLLDAADKGDATSLQSRAHLLKSMLSSVGGVRSYQLAADLERAARAGELSEASVLAAGLAGEIQALRIELADFIAAKAGR